MLQSQKRSGASGINSGIGITRKVNKKQIFTSCDWASGLEPTVPKYQRQNNSGNFNLLNN